MTTQCYFCRLFFLVSYCFVSLSACLSVYVFLHPLPGLFSKERETNYGVGSVRSMGSIQEEMREGNENNLFSTNKERTLKQDISSQPLDTTKSLKF